MHNCSNTKEQIIELLLDGADRPSADLLPPELLACRECSAEFDALNATLRITSRLREAATPREVYWTTYHAKLRQKLLNINSAARENNSSPGPSRLMTFFKSSIRVPVPVAVAAVVACLVLFLMSFRRTEPPNVQNTSVVHVPVEVPVIQEKIVTRVVYKQRRAQSRTPTRTDRNPAGENTFARSQKVEPSLIGFKPADDVKLTVIKGGSTNEK